MSEKRVTFSSFGFKYGLPEDANYIFDVRFIPNPYYIPDLRPLSGKDAKIQEFLNAHKETEEMFARLTEFLDYIIPANADRADKTDKNINVAIGCTGGRHRSVAFAERLYSIYKDKYANIAIKIKHRDILRDGEEI